MNTITTLVTDRRMDELNDPESEQHHLLLLIKRIVGGPVEELQIENAVTGRVTRITTTEDPDDDRRAFDAAVLKSLKEVLDIAGI